MHHLMAKFWWILVLRGGLGILLGLAASGWLLFLTQPSFDLFSLSLFLRPVALVVTLIMLLGLYALLDGIFAFVLGIQNYGDGRRWWTLMVEGLLSVGLGLLTLLRPNFAALVLLYWIATWAIFTGLLEIIQGFELNEYKERRRPFFFAGVISMIFGLLILYFRVGGVQLVWLMGIYAFLFGIPLLTLGFRLRHFVPSGRDIKKGQV